MKVRHILAAALALSFSATTAYGQADDELGTPVNLPGVNWNVYGALGQQKSISDGDVHGGHAVKVTITGKGANPWDVGASSPVQKPVKKGDRLVLMFFVRAPDAAVDKTVKLPAMIQLGKDPYTPVAQGTVEAGPKWTLVHVIGSADKDYAPGTLQAMTQLAADKQVIELGPVYVFAKPAG